MAEKGPRNVVSWRGGSFIRLDAGFWRPLCGEARDMPWTSRAASPGSGKTGTMAKWAVRQLEIAVSRPPWLERLGAKAADRNGGRACCYRGVLIVGLAAVFSVPSMGHAPSLQECFEGGD